MTQHADPTAVVTRDAGGAPTMQGAPRAEARPTMAFRPAAPPRNPGYGPPGPPGGFGLGSGVLRYEPLLLPLPHVEQHAVAASPAERPTNTTAGIALVTAVVTPVAIVLGVLAGQMIEQAGVPDQVAASSSPAIGPRAPGSAGSAGGVRAPASARSDLLVASGALSSSYDRFIADIKAHRGGTTAQQRDCAAFRAEVEKYGAAVAGIAFTPVDRGRVDGELNPALDRVVADLDAMATTSSDATMQDTAGRFDADWAALSTTTYAILGG